VSHRWRHVARRRQLFHIARAMLKNVVLQTYMRGV
jgi:hypothetical protein